MDAIKGSLGPLHLDTSSILDTLVRMFRSSPGKWSEGLSYFSQKLVAIGGTIETARRASAFAWNGFVDCSYPL
jgi:chaperone BCS1